MIMPSLRRARCAAMNSPFTIQPNEDETFVSVASRLAFVNGVEKLRHFLAEMEISPSDFRKQSPVAISMIADLAGLHVQSLEPFAHRLRGDGKIEFGGDIWPLKYLRFSYERVCPHCVLEAEGLPLDGSVRTPPPGFGSLVWVRAAWTIPDYRICAHHALPLIDLPPVDGLNRLDHVRRLREAFPLVAEAARTERASVSAVERYIDARLLGCADPHWCNTISLHAVLRFSLLLGSALSSEAAQRWGKHAEDTRAANVARGLEAVLGGPGAIRAALQTLRDRFQVPNGGPQACYQPLYEAMRGASAAEDAIAPFREIFREHLLESWAFGPGDLVLDTRLAARRLHSIRSATLEFGLHAATVRRAFAGAGLIAPVAVNRADADILVPAADAEAVLTPLADRLTREEVEAMLGLTRTVTESLRDAGYLETVRAGDDGRLHYTRSGVSALRARLDALLIAGQPVDAVTPVSIREAAKSLHLSHAAIVEKILVGETACWAERTPWKWCDLRLCREALWRSCDVEGNAGWISRNEAAQKLGVQPSVIDRLTQQGILQGEASTVPRTKLRLTRFLRSDIEGLISRCIPICELARVEGCTPSEVRRTLIGYGVKPLVVFPRSSGELYSRDEALRVMELIANGRGNRKR